MKDPKPKTNQKFRLKPKMTREEQAACGILGGRPKKWPDATVEEIAKTLEEDLDKAAENEEEFWWEHWCILRNIGPDIISSWAKEHPGFAKAYKKAKNYQKTFIYKGAIKNEYSANFSKFFLSTQYRDQFQEKQIIEHQGTPPVSVVNYSQKPPKTWQEEQNEQNNSTTPEV